MWAIYKKEIRQFLNSLIAYVVIGVFLTGIGLLTWVFPETSVLTYGYADMETLFTMGPFVFMFLIPAITMRMLAEENKTGTIELLLTRPLTDFQIIMGKFLAAFTLVVFSILPTLIYCYSISELGNPVGNLDVPGIAGSYLGLILLGGVFAAIGILASSLSENQIIAFIIAVFFCFFMFAGVESLAGLFSGRVSTLIEELSLSYHFEAMSRGLIDTRNVAYFVSVAAIVLLLTHLKMATRLFSFKPIRNRILRGFAMGLVTILVFNIAAANAYLRIDLTADKRFTLKPATGDLLCKLDQPLSIEILLAGDLPPQYLRLQKSLVQTLKEFENRSGSELNYFFTDFNDAENDQGRQENFDYLTTRLRLSPTQAIFNENGNQVRRFIFPYVIISYNGQAGAILISDGQKIGLTPDEAINESIENLEFNLAIGIQRLAKVDRKKIGLVRGHQELDSVNIAGFNAEMIQYFDLEYVDLAAQEKVEGFDALIVSKPLTAYSRDDKFKLDQYIMHGGNAIFLVDALNADMALAGGAGTVGLPIETGLDDMLFRYGVRLNKNYVQDIQNFGRYPVVVDDDENIINFPWPFYASVNDFTNHPITKNLDAVYARTFGTIDTVKAEGVKKTPLMYTSEFTRVLAAPAPVSFNDYANQPDPALFNHGKEAIAYLLEGNFTSLYKNRVLSASEKPEFKGTSEGGKIIVVSDGDLIRNEIDLRNGSPMELGFNPFREEGEKVRYANKEFLFNALTYLTNENGLITARAKEVLIRPLNKVKVRAEKTYWQVLNLVGPILVIVLFGLMRGLLRKRKYSNFGN
ncbi:gliding motility-associated ABC transporter substrate-binding protein GldG [Roseivirga sp. E12]|uniref:gliding motility-associated ABC transporter substrate-binding protein GldG n=1 Tax=Roseivirga sp. E12 TaxID=2819237 RepID=UPI001ABCA1F3|nr:gliding motility-associated ABC transporter substrate-binding protein GldG [Roseivirga sp. E12]MBO3700152.1 gliding motility-associated ABC transporter substrate-binding protein GldG [Roseivirga sp. E12]